MKNQDLLKLPGEVGEGTGDLQDARKKQRGHTPWLKLPETMAGKIRLLQWLFNCLCSQDAAFRRERKGSIVPAADDQSPSLAEEGGPLEDLPLLEPIPQHLDVPDFILRGLWGGRGLPFLPA